MAASSTDSPLSGRLASSLRAWANSSFICCSCSPGTTRGGFVSVRGKELTGPDGRPLTIADPLTVGSPAHPSFERSRSQCRFRSVDTRTVLAASPFELQ